MLNSEQVSKKIRNSVDTFHEKLATRLWTFHKMFKNSEWTVMVRNHWALTRNSLRLIPYVSFSESNDSDNAPLAQDSNPARLHDSSLFPSGLQWWCHWWKASITGQLAYTSKPPVEMFWAIVYLLRQEMVWLGFYHSPIWQCLSKRLSAFTTAR